MVYAPRSIVETSRLSRQPAAGLASGRSPNTGRDRLAAMILW